MVRIPTQTTQADPSHTLKLYLFVTVLLLLLAPVAPAVAQTTWHVDDDAPADPGPGDPTISDPLEDGSTEHPFDAIQEGIDVAVEGDTVLVADGTYTRVGNKNLDYAGKSITVRSENGPQDCVIDCTHNGRGFFFDDRENAESEVDGFTIANGNADAGGAICCDRASPTIMNCILVANVAEYGGAISCDRMSPEIIDCVLVGNAAGWGGGVCYYGGVGSLAVRNCLIAANTASRGGAAFVVHGTVVFANCTIAGNQGGIAGGGLRIVHDSDVTISNSVFSADQAPRGPEIDIWGTANPSTVTISYSDIHGGEAVIYAREGCTVVWEDSSIDADPLFRDPECADYRLQPGSPCIDTGTNEPPGGLPPYDLDGVSRPLDGDGDLEPWSGQFETADMGAYEYEYGPPTTPMICRVPTAFDFVGWEGEADPAPQTLSIWNCGIGTLSWEIAEDCPWVEVDPSDGESGGEIDEIIISVAIGGLPRGDYACTFDITDAAAANSPQPVHVNLRVLATLHVPGDYPTIQAAIDASVDGEVVLVADGTYVGEGNKNLNFGGRAITVRSEDGPENCIIDCENDEDGFRFHSGETSDAIVDGFTIRNGESGITCNNSSPMIVNCSITGCSGSGVGCGDGSPTIINCGISGNAYGGIRAWDDVTIAGCTISGNTAGWGGGIMCGQGSTWISDCVITGNTASNFGAGVGSEGGDVTITNCTISGNTCTASSVGGAGIVCLYGSVVITNCTISGNSSISHGGGLYWYRNNPIISNCTITHNSAGEEGGGVACGFASAATLANCIVWDNSAPLGPQIAVLGGDSAELSVWYDNVAGGEEAAYVPGGGTLIWGPANIDADPLFVDPNHADYRLGADSPCIDAGDNTAVPPWLLTDLDGNPRFWDDRQTPDTGNPDGIHPIVDMGAYEFGSEGCPDDDGDGFVTICHIPPGNPERARTITVPVQAAAAHLAHGDYCGPCNDEGSTMSIWRALSSLDAPNVATNDDSDVDTSLLRKDTP